MYKRILLKLSGESLAGENKQGIDTERLNQYAEQVKAIAQKGVQIGIVIGGFYHRCGKYVGHCR